MFEGLFQPMHLLVIAGIALLIFGPKKLPELGKGLGEGLRGFKAAMNPVSASSAENSGVVNTPVEQPLAFNAASAGERKEQA
ncbi:MAG: twin-arginine translocase TatA/TatE family subunit [Acidobacteriota bacterium]|nr:twin-arginine translocase TatA/TatE family subunit [Acidobacteriota bacterium]